MKDLTDALRQAAERPARDPSLSELQQELQHRHRRRRVALGVGCGAGVMAISAVLIGILQGDRPRVVSTAGSVTPTTVQGLPGRAHIGDGFCSPQLTNAGYWITPAGPGVVPVLTEQAAIEEARLYVGNGSGTFSAYFAMVRNPVADKVGLGEADVARATWVVEASDVVPPPLSDRGGARNPNSYPSYRMVAFIDDASGTRAGAWAACNEEPTSALVDLPNLLGRQVGEATARLRELGLIVAVEEQPVPDVPRGVVAAQDPAAGSRMAAGSRVTLKVSAGR